MGSGNYIGGATQHRSLGQNLPAVTEAYERHGNHFGIRHEKSTYVYEVASRNQYKDAQNFFDKIAYGGIVEQRLPNGGILVKMKDGSRITYRIVIKSPGSPAVEINITASAEPCGLKSHKIHFVKTKKGGKKEWVSSIGFSIRGRFLFSVP